MIEGEKMSSLEVEHGNFTKLASDYRHRPGYSQQLLKAILAEQRAHRQVSTIVDVGAGTGKLTKQLRALEVDSLTAVEPNDAMREAGIEYTDGLDVQWKKGSGESTTLPDQFADWVLMGSSFHWVDLEKGLAEFHRILKTGRNVYRRLESTGSRTFGIASEN